MYATGARRRADSIAEASFVGGAAAVVLVVVCVNLSGMVLVRSASRERELAVRLAIGASRRQLMQYLLSEAVILALLGGALGVAVIFGVPLALTTWAGTEFDEFGQGGLGLALLWGQEMSWSDARSVESLVYVLAVLIAIGVALLAGLPAARRAAAVEPIVAMRAE